MMFQTYVHKTVTKLCYDTYMEEDHRILPPKGEDDAEGAQRVFEEFLILYEPTLVRIEYYLEHVIEQVGPAYAEAYRPWHKAVHDLFRGVYLTVRNIPLPDPDSFIEALKMFGFDSAIQFLQDLCISCRIALERDWMEHFRQNIDLLLFSATILRREQQQALAH